MLMHWLDFVRRLVAIRLARDRMLYKWKYKNFEDLMIILNRSF